MIQAHNIHKQYGTLSVLSGVQFQLESGRSLGILGSSGCGKTTLLQIMAGLLPADQGELLLDGQAAFDLTPAERGTVYLSQEPLLFPHLTAFENIAFGLRVRKQPSADVRAQVQDMLGQLGLEGLGDRMPTALSGGQRQRVAFGRAIIIRPRVLLLDEPFGSLDAPTRADMQQLYRRLCAAHRITTVFVTHDLREALVMGDELARMEAGRLTVYPSRRAFMEAPGSGVREEWAFWQRTLSGEGLLPGTTAAGDVFAAGRSTDLPIPPHSPGPEKKVPDTDA
ncbi:MAG: ATP-binding cassette domain-containing protein [Bacteroidetes bacterium]|nr:ATP-binding cassette domain-containing protein [Bacteroidota bacterium]